MPAPPSTSSSCAPPWSRPGATGVVCYLAKFQFSRGFFFLLIILGMPALLLGRFVLRRVVYVLRRRGYLVHRVIVAGSAAQVDEVARVLDRERWLGYHVIGAVAAGGRGRRAARPAGCRSSARPRAPPRSSPTPTATSCCSPAVRSTSAQQMRRAAWELAETSVQIMLVPSLTDVAGDRVRVRPAAGLQLMELEGPRAQNATRVSKRTFDLVGAAVLLVLRQPAAHRHGDRDQGRTTAGPCSSASSGWDATATSSTATSSARWSIGADGMLDTVAAANKHEEGHVLFKAEHDPRVTRPGRLIRRFSLDEMPQFLNVLRGEMSLVGPRPPLPGEVERYSDDVRRRLAVRPGMTGLWQVSGRSDLSWEDSVRLDLYYVDNWSIVQDLAILARTMLAVVSSRGAY